MSSEFNAEKVWNSKLFHNSQMFYYAEQTQFSFFLLKFYTISIL